MKKRGQVILEYVLLLLVVVTIAGILTSTLGPKGYSVKYWKVVIQRIGGYEAGNNNP